MDDLISRATALDTIDGIKPMQGNMEQLAMKALCWAAVKTTPAVDAVPVEWLKQKRDCQNDSWDYLSNAIDYIIAVYRKEQETQDDACRY